jgi:hypothetical protein
MDRYEHESGKLNPRAPEEVSTFAFLIGEWRCQARLKREAGTWEDLQATWIGRSVLDGYAIMEEYRMTRPAGELLVLGMNVRSYDVKKKAWSMKWLNALDGSWVDLGPEELGGVKIDQASITYSLEEPVGEHALTRATYFDISRDHFSWRGERSNDGKTWEEFLLIEAHRNDD